MNNAHAHRIVTVSLPVTNRQASLELRAKFHHALKALNISPVYISLATSDFSVLYRHLHEGSEATVEITSASRTIGISLIGIVDNQAEVRKLQAKLIHFRIARAEQVSDGQVHITASYQYRVSQEPDIQLVQQRLSQQTLIEKELTARITKDQLNATKDRLSIVESDLKIAADIQQHMLLSKEQLKTIDPQLDCHAYIVPCKEVGGDFFDIIRLEEDRFAVVAGDVSGKGVPAAMMMATCSTLIRAYCETGYSPSSIAYKTNNRLLQGNDSECMFTTLFLAVIDCKESKLTYCNAGHCPGLIIHSSLSSEELATVHGPALGIFQNHTFREDTTSFKPGDRLVLFTDGVTESFNGVGELYGFERLHDYCLNCSPEAGSRRFLSGLLLDINQFSGTELAHDDVTLLAVRRQIKPASTDITQYSLKARALDGDLTRLKQQVETICLTLELETETLSILLLVLDELVGNIIRHGIVEKVPNIVITLDLRYESGCLDLLLKDNSNPFDPFLIAKPSVDLGVEEREMGGLGLFLVRSLTDNFSYHYDDPWNCINLQVSNNRKVD